MTLIPSHEDLLPDALQDAVKPESILRESEEILRLVANAAPVMIWVSGTDKLCTYFNKPWLDFTGRSLEAEVGNGWADGIHPEDLAKCLDIYTQSFDERREFTMEYRLRRYDGEYRWILDMGVPRLQLDGSFSGYIGSCIDITDRKQMNAALRESEERFRLAAHAGKMFAYEWDAVTDVITRSGECSHILGVDEKTPFTGEQAISKVHPEDRQRLKTAIAKLTLEKPELQISYRMVHHDGTVIWVERQSRAYFNEQNQLLRITGMIADITERKLVEESQNLLRRLLDGSNDAFEVIDPQTMRFLDVNEKACEELGYSREELLSLTVRDIDPDAGDSCRARVLDEMERSGFSIFESFHQRKDGSTFPVEVNIKMVHFDRDYIVCVSRDITERKQAQQELDVFHHLFIEASLGIAVEDMEGNILLANPALCSILGYRTEELLGMNCSQFADPSDSEDDWAHFQNLSAGAISRYSIEKRYRQKDGTKIWGRLNVCLLKRSNESTPLVLALVEDITEQKLAGDLVRSKELELSEAQRLAGVGSWQWDPVKDAVTWSRELYRIVGRDPNLPAPNYYQEHSQYYTQESWERLQTAVEEALRTGKPYELDLQMIHTDGHTRWVTARGETQHANKGAFCLLRGTIQDITARKEMEEVLSTQSRRLIEAQDAERTRIARDLHDDIGQRMALLLGSIEHMKQVLPDSLCEVRKHLEEIQCQTSSISSDIQALSHQLHSNKLEHLGVVAAMKGFCKELSEQQRVEIDFIHEGVSPDVPQEVSLCLFRVLQEALHNAVKHSGVRYFKVELQGTANSIFLTMHDSGTGFDLDAAIRGGGLGLTSMQERLKLVNGELTIESALQRGTTIRARAPFHSQNIPVRIVG